MVLNIVITGAMKVTQELFEEYLHIFSADPKFVAGDIELSVETLSFIGKVCSDKVYIFQQVRTFPFIYLIYVYSPHLSDS